MARSQRVLQHFVVMGAGLALLSAQAGQAQTALSPPATRAAASPAATLQVTGTDSRFTVLANHADVQDVLKLIFDQAGKQFALDGSVTGSVTMRLSNQPLAAVLAAICKQNFLRYNLNVNSGITYFERDEAAVRAAFARLRALDATMRDALRNMGFGIPAESQFGYAPQSRGSNLDNMASGAIPGVGGGAGPGRRALESASPALQKGRAPDGPETDKDKADDGSRNDKPRFQEAPAAAINGTVTENGSLLDLNNPSDYQQFLQSNNFVSIRVPKDKPEPVYSILQKLGQQANVTILIDPNVPDGSKFTIRGTLSPRPLPDALNILAPFAHLNWRWVGNVIFIMPAPDFELFIGDETTPRASYNTQNNTGRNRGAAPGSPAGLPTPAAPAPSDKKTDSPPKKP